MRATPLRWIAPLALGCFVDCADVDGGVVPVTTEEPVVLDRPASDLVDRGLDAACTRCGRPCADDMACVAGACVPPQGSAPRLLLPASLGRVTTQRPTMRWIPTAGSAGTLVEVCRDRACDDVVLRAERTTDSFRPETPLSPGVYFWRVRARVGAEYSRKASATWEFVVRARDAAVDSSFGRLWDFNGDAYADVALQMGTVRDLSIFLGGAGGLSTRPDFAVPMRREGFDVRPSAGGDLNGDGFADLLVREFAPNDPVPRRVLLVPGGPRPSLDRAIELRSAQPWARNLSITGDLDGDGYADLLGVDPERPGVSGLVRVWFGGPRGVEAEPRRLLEGRLDTNVASSIGGVGDINGDTLPDLVIGAPAAGGGAGQAVAWINGRCTEGAVVPLGRGEAPGGRYGDAVALSGDVNGDGYADPVVALPYGPSDTDRSAVRVYAGPVEPVLAPTSLPFERAQTEGIRPVYGGDYNGDGWSDLVLWMHNVGPGPRFVVYAGGPEGLRTRPDRVVYAADFGSRETALSVGNAGDTDRDGYDDLLVFLAPGEVLIARGGPGGPTIGPAPLLVLP